MPTGNLGASCRRGSATPELQMSWHPGMPCRWADGTASAEPLAWAPAFAGATAHQSDRSSPRRRGSRDASPSNERSSRHLGPCLRRGDPVPRWWSSPRKRGSRGSLAVERAEQLAPGPLPSQGRPLSKVGVIPTNAGIQGCLADARTARPATAPAQATGRD